MSDFTEQALLQQRHAVPVSGEHLELLGKRASSLWSSGAYETLNEAVVDIVKTAGLSPEQVKRVIEFTNTDAYLREFRKEGEHRVVDFSLADPSIIFKDLNDGGGGTVFDRGDGDYTIAPSEKKASSFREIEEAFSSSGKEYPQANPFSELEGVRYKLAAALDYTSNQLNALEIDYMDFSNEVYQGVKQAALSGHSLGEILQVMSKASPSIEHVKIAFGYLSPRLIQDQVFPSQEAINGSLQKTASAHLRVNEDHPLVRSFSSYCSTISKLAQVRIARAELNQHLNDTTNFLLKAAGAIQAVTGAAKKVGDKTAPAVKGVASWMGAKDSTAEGLGNAAGWAVAHSPHAAALVGANEVRRHLKYSPAYQKAIGMTVPTSDAYAQREAEIANTYGRYPT